MYCVVTFTFVLIRFMPGGPIDYIQAQYAQQPTYSPAEIRQIVELYTNIRPDEPIWKQYISYISSILQGDLGQSVIEGEPVAEVLANAMPWTIFISAVSLFFIFTIAITLGALMAYSEGSRFDIGATISSIGLTSIPYYVVAIILLWFLGYQWELFPTGGRVDPTTTAGFNLSFIISVLYHGALPIASLVIASFGEQAIAMRGNSIQILGNDYLRVARLRGLSERRIALWYVGRNALLPMYTSIMIALGTLFGGSVILETIFTYPGIGYYMFRSIVARDYPLMMGAFLFITAGVVLGVYLADLTYGLIDPRAGEGGNRESF
jgi:peptide/nickel transport system permease protein